MALPDCISPKKRLFIWFPNIEPEVSRKQWKTRHIENKSVVKVLAEMIPYRPRNGGRKHWITYWTTVYRMEYTLKRNSKNREENRDTSKIAGHAKFFHMWCFFPICCLHQKELKFFGPCLPAKSDKYLEGIYINIKFITFIVIQNIVAHDFKERYMKIKFRKACLL